MISVQLTGQADLKATLEGLSKAVKRRLAREAVTAAALPVVRAVEVNARKIADTGALHESIGVKSIAWKNGNATAVIGPRKGQWGPKRRRPVKYAHLLEFGHYTAAKSGVTPAQLAKGTRGKTRRDNTLAEQAYVLPKPFMRPAWAATKGVALDQMGKWLGPRVEAAAKRLEKRRKRST